MSTSTPPPNTPPLESSPIHSSRVTTALGGKATSPTQFQQVKVASAQPSPQAAPAVAKPRKVNTTFDDDPKAIAHRNNIEAMKRVFGAVITTVDQATDTARKFLKMLDTKDGREECKRQGFDLDVASEFTEEMDAVIEKRKPRA